MNTVTALGRARELREVFRQYFGSDSQVFRAPGRVNLIGEHTDYNLGFVMPAAIDFYTWVAIAPKKQDDRVLTVFSKEFGEQRHIELDSIEARPTGHWSDYVRGMAAVLQRQGVRIGGTNMLVLGEVPIGSGLSSSAAVEVSSGFALLQVHGHPVDRTRLALAAQQAEHEYVGTLCGIMDQFISCFGEAGHALLIDCRSLEKRAVPVPENVALVICNTMVKHSLATGEYNQRRRECEEAVRLLAQPLPAIQSLRDVSVADFEEHAAVLPDLIRRRARHVVMENKRVLDAEVALRQRDMCTFGRLLAESHRSLRDDYEVSCRELDVMVEIAARQPGVFGARMTGGGFGGCTINAVEAGAAEEFRRNVAREYEAATGNQPHIYISTPSAGAARAA